MSIEALIPILLALIAAVPGLLAFRSQRVKHSAEAADLEDQITERVLHRAKVEIDRLEDELRELRRRDRTRGEELAALRSENQALRKRVREQDAKILEQDKKIHEQDAAILALTAQVESLGEKPVVNGRQRKGE
jgi:chromosome segregation ATPase